MFGDIKTKFKLFSLQILMFAAFFVWALPGNAQTGNPDAGDIETGLVGWWKLDDENGTQITDSSSNANNGSKQKKLDIN